VIDMKSSLSELLRPTSLADLIQPQEVIQGLERMVRQRSLVSMLFHGKPGIGKTSAARILIKELAADVLEVNGSRSTGIVDVRSKIESFCASSSLFSDLKVCFIDECEFLSANAQAALRGIIENAHNVRFLLTANNINKLDPALRSRCRPISFDVGPQNADAVINRLQPRYQGKLSKLGYDIDAAWLERELHVCFPDLRKLANTIEFTYGPPSDEQIALFQMEQAREEQEPDTLDAAQMALEDA
jgi:replication-associated recombination protein RarA